MGKKITNIESLVLSLKSKQKLHIKVMNLGENIGMDLAFFSYYYVLRKIFPGIIIDLFRSNVDETNCIGLDKYAKYVELPLNSLTLAVVKQRYADGTDWVQKLRKGEDIFPPRFLDFSGYDYVWGIGMGSCETITDKIPDNIGYITDGVVAGAIEAINNEHHIIESPYTTVLDLPNTKPWSRCILEYLCYWHPDYPVKLLPAADTLGNEYSDYIRMSARWPDHCRWYYTVDRQFQLMHKIIDRIQAAGKKVKVMFTLKDLEVGNNFNRGQTIDKLKTLQDRCDEITFTYSWTIAPYHARKSEQAELESLSVAGITNIRKVNIWEDLILGSKCKTYLSEVGGYSELINLFRKDNRGTFIIPVSYGMTGSYTIFNKDRQPVKMKVAPIVYDQVYNCTPTLSAPDDPEGYRTLHWDIEFRGSKTRVGNNCHGDDWRYFDEAQNSLFKTMYEQTVDELADAVAEHYVS